MDKKFILICGMRRSGTTLCFNIVRALLEQHNLDINFFNVNKDESSPLNVAETHGNGGKWCEYATTIIRTRRDIRDVIASCIRKFLNFENNHIEIGQRELELYTSWEAYYDYEFIYEKYKNNPLVVIREMASTLELPENSNIVKSVHNEVEGLPNNPNLLTNLNFDRNNSLWQKTRMCQGHQSNKGIIGAYKDFFTKEELTNIESNFGDWLKGKGYLI